MSRPWMFWGQWTMISAPLFFQEGLECPVGTWWDHTITQQAKGTVTCCMGHETKLRAGSQLHHTPPVAVTSWHEAFGGSGSVNAACCGLLGLLLLYHTFSPPLPHPGQGGAKAEPGWWSGP